ncbi:tyrosine-tRNA ligase-like protein [Trifolium pratense]|uniref:tyrosine--tRNA ligase n=1 Tax=Trifolium pratense TaxID=57577 RepID=A0A2K3NGS3_TRIPR|nr:tyrosine-tRNA ligase-like protein [Trifolium pratense]
MAVLKSSDDSNATTTDQYIPFYTILHILFFSTHSSQLFQFLNFRSLVDHGLLNRDHVDGSLLGNTNTAGYGGLIHDDNGVFMLGFYGAATIQSILFAELMAVLHELEVISFEPSGHMTIDELHACMVGIMKLKTIHVNKLVSAGCRVKIVIADCFAKLNSNKIGGNLKKIETIGRYMIKKTWKAIGIDLKGGADEYWPLVLDIAQKLSVQRILRRKLFHMIH